MENQQLGNYETNSRFPPAPESTARKSRLSNITSVTEHYRQKACASSELVQIDCMSVNKSVSAMVEASSSTPCDTPTGYRKTVHQARTT